MIIPNQNLSHAQTNSILRRQTDSQNHHHNSTGAFYIIAGLILLILVNLLLVIGLLIQSRRLDSRLAAAVESSKRRAINPSQGTSMAPVIPPSRPPRGSFPSIVCPNAGRSSTAQFCSNSDSQSSSSSDTTESTVSSDRILVKKDSPMTGEGGEIFNFLIEPVSPSSDNQNHIKFTPLAP